MINTSDLTNYITYINDRTKKRKNNPDDIERLIYNTSINTIESTIANVPSIVLNEFIIHTITDYKKKKDMISGESDSEQKFYDMALYSVIIHIMDEYISSSTTTDFKSYLQDYKDKINKNDKPIKMRQTITTIPFTTLMEILLKSNPLNKKPPTKSTMHTYSNDDVTDDDFDDEDDSDYVPDETDLLDKISPVKHNITKRDKKQKVTNRKPNDFINEMFKLGGTQTDEKDILQYYSKLSPREKNKTFLKLKEIGSYHNVDTPNLFRIMSYPIPTDQKNHIIKNYITLLNSHFPDNKLRTWFENVMLLPFGKYKGIDVKAMDSAEDIKHFIKNLRTIMDAAVWGHNDAKHQIVQMMAQQIGNSECKGNIIGLWGPPGNGKTTLIKEGIAKAMNKPFIFISLGGATDASFLEGHSYTYEGSIYGRIANGLITSGCMDPIIYFDELDKISQTPKGDEITNILVHLTDPVQNTHFRDKYFHGIDIDLSRATIIFSFNDISRVNPILLDRIMAIETKYLMTPQKIHIAQNYLLPNIMKEMGLISTDIVFSDKNISKIINKYTREGGVRKLKTLLYSIVREINLNKIEETELFGKKVSFPMTVKSKYVKLFLKLKIPIVPETIPTNAKVGFINGLYAGSLGVGGVLPIQILWTPTREPLVPKLTGNLKKVIKESASVATTLAWNHIDSDLQSDYSLKWKTKPKGFHIHFPEGAIPKDGPSAGTALSVALYSMLTNKPIKPYLAITGEINFEGHVTAIGGLEEKLVGAKKAGVRHALVPYENAIHLEKVKERNPQLLDDNFNVTLIKTLDEALQHSLE